MTRNQISIRQTGPVNRREPLLNVRNPPSSPAARARFAEVAGGTAAECAAVACCCPCGLVNLLLLAVYKLPAGLYKRAIRRRRRKILMRKGVLPHPSTTATETSIDDPARRRWGSDEAVVLEISGRKVEKELLELEREMRERFFRSGFWRSPSSEEGDDT